MSQQSRVVVESTRSGAEMWKGYFQDEPSECCQCQRRPRGRVGVTFRLRGVGTDVPDVGTAEATGRQGG